MPDISNGSYGTRVIQASNIAPQATKDQMQTLFSHVGKVEDIRLYPMIRDVAVPVQVRICFVKFAEPTSVGLAQHLGNTVFIDRAIMVIPYDAGELPDEAKAMEILNSGTALPSMTEPKLPPHLICTVEGIPPNQTIATADSRLAVEGLPPYPPIPASLDSRKIEEIRRTVVAVNLDSNLSADQVIDFFSSAGEVKYFRFCSREGDGTKYSLVEFTDQSSIYAALKLNNKTLGDNVVRVQHATQAIVKPHGKTNEAAQKEIEEAVKRVKEAQSSLTAELDPEATAPSAPVTPAEVERRRSRSPSKTHSARSVSRRSRSAERLSSASRKRSLSRTKERKRSRSRDRKRSRSRDRSRKSRSRSRDRRRRSKSRDRDKDRKKGRSRSRSRSKRGSSRSRDKDRKDRDRRDRKDRDRSKDRSSDSKKEDKKKEERSRKRSRSRSRGKSPSRSSRRSRSRSKGRKDEDRKDKDRKEKDRDKDRKRDRSHDRKKDDDRKRDKEKRSKDKKKESKVALDYDEKDESPRRKSDAEESEDEAARKYASSKSSKGAKKAESDSEEERKPSKRVESDSEDDRKSDVSKAASEKSRESSD